MCGIAGVIHRSAQAETSELTEMLAALVHRGPDDSGCYADGPVVLGQRRLAILDLVTGHQPLSNEDGSIWITFNGEIYNHRELRRHLEAGGHAFRTRSDTEVIVHAYEQYGDSFVRELRGMFAFALWDRRKGRLLLARDHVGKKPLFYALDGERLLFASELQAIVPRLSRPAPPDLRAIDEYLTYGYIPAPRTGFAGISKLPPGHLLAIDLDRPDAPLASQRFWTLAYEPKHTASEAELEEQLLAQLEDAIRLRILADVPVGALLSGGVDSSLMVALMARASPERVKTFCIGFDDQSFNELPYARRVAEIVGTDHHELMVRPDALEVLPLLVRHYGEPFADSSAIPSYYVARMTREHVKVVLNGDGGDECFAGYDRYLGSGLADRYQRIPEFLRNGLLKPIAALIPRRLDPRSRLRQAKKFVETAGRPYAVRYARWMTFFDPDLKQSLYHGDFAAQLGAVDGAEWLRAILAEQEAAWSARLDQLLATDVVSYLPYDLLVKMDIATMANSLEARSPFLDVRVMEFAARLSPDLKIRNGRLKYLSKRLAKRFFPADLIDRRKMGFGVPLGSWLRNELRPLLQEVLLGKKALERGYFEPRALRQLVAEHQAGHDHASRLWALLWLELWHREFIDERTGARATDPEVLPSMQPPPTLAINSF